MGLYIPANEVWIKIGGDKGGYQNINVTPYMHYHVPDHMRNLWVFSGQGELGESLNIVHTNPYRC